MNQKDIDAMHADLHAQINRNGQGLMDARITEALHRAGVTRADIQARTVRCHLVTQSHPECCGTGVVIEGKIPADYEGASVGVRLCSCVRVEIVRTLPR